MSGRHSLIELDHRILKQLGRMRFATIDQLSYWCDASDRSISRRLKTLLDDNLVRSERQARPAIWQLSFAGSQVVQMPMPAGRRQASWSVMAHACHTNQVEIALRTQHPGFHFMDRITLMKQGFNPAHGEHGGMDATQASYFVLLDDYAMQSDRIEHAWTRRHTPNTDYWSDMTGRAWRDVVHRFMVFTTDLLRINLHQSFANRHQLPADVLHLKGLWP